MHLTSSRKCLGVSASRTSLSHAIALKSAKFMDSLLPTPLQLDSGFAMLLRSV